jgi:hypothetical protein
MKFHPRFIFILPDKYIPVFLLILQEQAIKNQKPVRTPALTKARYDQSFA